MRALREMGANVRLCKGAYKEPPEIAFPDKRDVDASFVELAEAFLDPRGLPSTAFLAIATHDEKLIDRLERYAAAQGLDRSRFEFQMLHGIRPRLQRQLVAQGYQVRVYVPYGSHWYPYFMRRLAERPANVVFLVSNLFRR